MRGSYWDLRHLSASTSESEIAKQIDEIGGRRRAGNLYRHPVGPRRVCHPTGRDGGTPAGAPFPQGLYFTNTADWGCRNTNPTSCLGITIPVVTWSTPWTFLGARVQFFSVTPVIEIGTNNITLLIMPAFSIRLFGQLAWDLGNGFGFSYGCLLRC